MMRHPHLKGTSDEFVDLLVALLTQPANVPDHGIRLTDVAELHRLELVLGRPIDHQHAQRVMEAVETQLRQLLVGTAWYLLSGEGFAKMLPLYKPWPLMIAPAVVTSIGRAYHEEHRPDIALSLSRHFRYERSLWPRFAEEARNLNLTPGRVIKTCYLV